MNQSTYMFQISQFEVDQSTNTNEGNYMFQMGQWFRLRRQRHWMHWFWRFGPSQILRVQSREGLNISYPCVRGAQSNLVWAMRFQQKGWQFSKFLVRRKHSKRNKRILLQYGNNMGLWVDPHHTCSCLKEKNTNTKSWKNKEANHEDNRK